MPDPFEPQAVPVKRMSADVRASIIVDSIGKLSDGDYRERVHATAVEQILAAVAQATSNEDDDLIFHDRP